MKKPPHWHNINGRFVRRKLVSRRKRIQKYLLLFIESFLLISRKTYILTKKTLSSCAEK